MTASSEVSVTRSGKLLSQLRVDAAELEVPVTWLVVGLVCDAAEHLSGYVAPRVLDSRLTSRRRTQHDILQCA
jgi:hypothetical protein